MRLPSLLVLSFLFFSFNSGASTLESKDWVAYVNPMNSPEEYYLSNQDQISQIPNGTGLQILFTSQGKYYLLAGPRANRLLTVIGGKIENLKAPFLSQLQEEFGEETYGVMAIDTALPFPSQFFWLMINDEPHPLEIVSESTLIHDSPSKFAYVTFTGLVSDISEEALDKLATQLTPTALFWEKLGSFLHQHLNQAPKDEQFEAYWQDQQQRLNQVLAELSKDYDRLSHKGQLLISPEQAFSVSTIEEAWDVLRHLHTYSQLKYHAQNTVGRYSERKGYYVIDARSLLHAVQSDNTPITDIHGRQIASSVFNKEAVEYIFPRIMEDNNREVTSFIENQANIHKRPIQ
ncbi:hypothetical protein [Legionella sp. W05-934-2]|uniref:hypothetical protein n=1 Tax=Legionella sp. W05-934-2 TaxID=1198649 RepID=UPI0034630D7B